MPTGVTNYVSVVDFEGDEFWMVEKAGITRKTSRSQRRFRPCPPRGHSEDPNLEVHAQTVGMELYTKPGKLDALDTGARLQIVGADLLQRGKRSATLPRSGKPIPLPLPRHPCPSF